MFLPQSPSSPSLCSKICFDTCPFPFILWLSHFSLKQPSISCLTTLWSWLSVVNDRDALDPACRRHPGLLPEFWPLSTAETMHFVSVCVGAFLFLTGTRCATGSGLGAGGGGYRMRENGSGNGSLRRGRGQRKNRVVFRGKVNQSFTTASVEGKSTSLAHSSTNAS